MTRPLRLLSALNSTSNSTPAAAEPPEAVAFESDFVVILAALLCALICVVGLIAVARCAWLRRGGSPASGGSPGGQPSANRGLKKKILQSLPKFAYNAASAGKFTPECAICLTEYAGGDEIRVMPQCGHGFHVECIDMWLGSHSSCPSCRQMLVVARCRKCGEFPAAAELKARQDGAAGSSGFLP
ncbi:hypothetical protein RJ639_034336 [Escallonia herrerae]|uniref:RING-type domain-containing protein n=1 Tax=Escallonia herrerae TaxID=1293975 RepID=A0AA88WUC0_9ASTE|nr:hypothetical protein RJ639_034336 [Escallonia herrerae]